MSTPQPGDALGASYRLVKHIGSGAAGDVWLTESTRDDATYAAKILKAEHANDADLVERFVRERSVLIGLRHPNIVAVRDLVVEGSTLAIVMDYIAGGTLRDLLAAQKTLPAAEALNLAAQIFDGLTEAHRLQVTHRDIKPDNVLLAEAWQPGQRQTVRVTDFGIASVVSARQRQTSGMLGTPQYMAPEIISHGHSTSAADIYSTGVLLYELLSGRTPFDGPGTDFTIAYRHVTALPPELDIPRELWRAVNDLLAKDPRDRPSAAEAAATMRRLAPKFHDLPALAPAAVAEDFVEAERPRTMLRSDLLHETNLTGDVESSVAQDAPELGPAPQHTVLRPMPVARTSEPDEPATEQTPADEQQSWFTKKNIVLGLCGLVLLVALVVGGIWLFTGNADDAQTASDTALQASQQDPPLPTGLAVSRQASYDPDAEQITVEITYSAQRAPLSGQFLEVLPATDPEAEACPAVSWEGAAAKSHQTSNTGLRAECGWQLDGVDIPANDQLTVTATLPGSITDQQELNAWLEAAAQATNTALHNPDASSTAYPVQRLMDIRVETPSRTVSQTPLPITLLPVWPSGPDELNPLYQSPSSGSPSKMLQNIAGDESGVRFSDNCSGAVAISSDGLTVTALSVTPQCSIHASVGNFTSLQSSPLSITTRD
ncbi:serine/threonine-protein kinase [Enteractinococcus coprophilus]|uniref:non-specific serine/threonine protein kinase n=1 Tax=Enteractinococcus coprophilus TaxID=1027633 RepID=A0A543ANZ3_9MICC|nr:serine/threonine-protein kinase [Enteractinococcus coprophilus]TQL74300.1 serine/threonine-protein kinase [Enteractinococcus coprophilus]